jgi:glycosyltransferase involved in cell wall biosynthesis
MLGLAQALSTVCESQFLSFAEGGRCAAFLDEVQHRGFYGRVLAHDTPHLWAAIRELTEIIRRSHAALICCHSYKADLLGLIAGRRAGVPVVAVSRGWTGESFKVRCYDALDRRVLRWMDAVVCVSHGQARKVFRAGVSPARVVVIPNAVRPERFAQPDSSYRDRLRGFFADRVDRIIVAAGRLSPEKGFDILIEAADQVIKPEPSLGFVLFGDGPLREQLQRQIEQRGLTDVFVLPGFRSDLDRFLPFADLLVLPSYTEGLPNVVLEAFAAGIPVVATAVGGTPELVEDGVNGYLVPAGNPGLLAQRILDAIADDNRRKAMGQCGRQRVLDQFTFEAQGQQYLWLYARLLNLPPSRSPIGKVGEFAGREPVNVG